MQLPSKLRAARDRFANFLERFAGQFAVVSSLGQVAKRDDTDACADIVSQDQPTDWLIFHQLRCLPLGFRGTAVWSTWSANNKPTDGTFFVGHAGQLFLFHLQANQGRDVRILLGNLDQRPN